MKLIIGLGNPGKEYEKTRHNAGFLAVEAVGSTPTPLYKGVGVAWRFEKKFNAEIREGKIGSEKVVLAKPQTYMNKSGGAVGALARFYKIKPMDVWVIHDDLDLPLGTLRIKAAGSSGGHRGVQSIIDTIGAEFVRFRIGTAGTKRSAQPAEKFVLGKFSAAELKKLTPVLHRVSEAIEAGIDKGLPTAMSLYSH